MKQVKKIYWGIMFIAMAALLIAGSMGYLKGFGVWNIIATIILGSSFLSGLFKLEFGNMVVSAAIFLWINDEWLGIGKIPFWPLFGAAILLTIGLHILFPHAGKKHKWHKHIASHVNNGIHVNVNDGENKAHVEYTTSENGEVIKCEVAFSEAVKYVNSMELCRLETECAFGSLKVYFENDTLKNGEAWVDAESSFGSTIFFVPASWKVIMDMDTAFGGAKETGHCNPNGENVLHISGDVAFGSLEIKYV
ncbi:MAG: hypothetical protein E7287_08210 [Lachnospiraceae bacterium]|nr:hypothetical protein [Lachnospiraceae bacterium]